jgi:two-component system, cell cycle sensor histidine kinase and response regulator CckA
LDRQPWAATHLFAIGRHPDHSALPPHKANTADDAMSTARKILVVEDEVPVRELLAWILVSAGYEVQVADCGEQALFLLVREGFDLIITDNCMPGMSGVELALAAKARLPALPIVMLSGNPPETPLPCLDLVLRKPNGTQHLLQTVNQLLYRTKKAEASSHDCQFH